MSALPSTTGFLPSPPRGIVWQEGLGLFCLQEPVDVPAQEAFRGPTKEAEKVTQNVSLHAGSVGLLLDVGKTNTITVPLFRHRDDWGRLVVISRVVEGGEEFKI